MRRTDRELKRIDEIHAILKKASIGHLALTDQDYPYLVALNFGVEYTNPLRIYFHCATEGKKIDIIRKNNKACFQVEIDIELTRGKKACNWGIYYRSVVAFGNIEILEETSEKIKGLDVIMTHYSNGDRFEYDENILKRTLVLKMTVNKVTGKSKTLKVKE